MSLSLEIRFVENRVYFIWPGLYFIFFPDWRNKYITDINHHDWLLLDKNIYFKPILFFWFVFFLSAITPRQYRPNPAPIFFKFVFFIGQLLIFLRYFPDFPLLESCRGSRTLVQCVELIDMMRSALVPSVWGENLKVNLCPRRLFWGRSKLIWGGFWVGGVG